MTIILTPSGWYGDDTGSWTNKKETAINSTEIGGSYPGLGVQLSSQSANTLSGDDFISGKGSSYGIVLTDSKLDMGRGNDFLEARGGFYGTRIGGTQVITAEGNDSIIGIGDYGGVRLDFSSNLDMGKGNDSIFAKGLSDIGLNLDQTAVINMGKGRDRVEAESGFIGIGMTDHSTLNTGDGNDSIIGTGVYGIILDGESLINTGDGNDSVKALALNGDIGVFFGDGSGWVLLGSGNDKLVGFGIGNFDGGSGIDTLTLPLGSHEVYVDPLQGNVIFGNVMNTTGFEFVKVGNNTYKVDTLISGIPIGC